MAQPKKTSEPLSILTLASIAVVIAALYLGKGLLVPLTLAVLLSFLLSPICDWLERRWLGRIPAVLVTAFLGFSVLGMVGWTAAVQITSLAPKIPEYRTNIETKISSVNSYTVAALRNITSTAHEMGAKLSPTELANEGLGNVEQPYSVRVVSSPSSPLQIFGGMFGTLLEVLGSSGIVIVLVVFFLVQREDLRDRFIHLIGKTHVIVTTQMLEDAGTRVTRYLSMLFLMNVTFGISVGIGLYLIGVPNAVLWGILAAVLRFIPYIGPWIAAAMPLALSMAISPGWAAPLLTVALFMALELFNNNALEPWLYGKNTGVSAVAVLVAAVFWMWLWGPVGLLLATPLTVCLLVVGKHVPQLSFLSILLGNDPVFEPPERIYHRLVAGDYEEAAELFEDCLEHQSLAQVYDTVLIPALAMAETHSQLGELNEAKHSFIMESLKEMIQDQGERQQVLLAKQEIADAQQEDGDSVAVDEISSSPLSVVCLPARSEADEIVALMLAQALATSGCHVQAISVTALAGDMVDLVDQCTAADVVCISAMPPAAVMHARYLSKRLRGRLPEVNLVVGLWDAQCDLNKSRERIGCDAVVVATLTAAQEQISTRIVPHLPRPDTQAQPERRPMIMART
ncbi:MAG: AI-2E family transporter [Planctomycetota bacterium]